jgi:hypothetical protein
MSQGPNLKADRIKYTNWSKKSPTWIWGPAHEIRVQHIPGYKGHVHGLVPENLHGKAYGRTTATAINKKQHSVRSSYEPTFISQNRKEFSPANFRRYLERPNVMGQKDYDDYAKNINDEMFDHKTRVIEKSKPDMATTMCSKTSSSFFPARQTTRQARFSMSQAPRSKSFQLTQAFPYHLKLLLS